jgi:PAS domain S-box-containing protein
MIHVLLVDDDNRQRRLSRALLEDAGYLVEDAADALAALCCAKTRRPDIILSDVMMDRIDGFGLCRRLQDDVRLSSIPVVLVSAHYDDPAAYELARTLGASALITRTPDFSAELAGLAACANGQPRFAGRPRRDSYEAHLEANAGQLTKLVEQARCAEQRWRSVFDHAHDTLTVLDADGVIIEANQRWQDVLGTAPAALIGHHIREFAPPELAESNLSAFRQLIASGTMRAVVPLRHASGKVVHVDFSGRVIDLDGAPHVIAIGRDITEQIEAERRAAAAEAERRKLEERLAHAQRLETIGQLTGGIAHDFNNILCAVLTNAEFLTTDLAVDDPRRCDALEIRDAALRATDLVKRLLAFGRRQVMQLVDVDVGAVVRSVSQMLKRIIGAAVDVRIVELSDDALVRADVVQLEQVIVNLVVNARDAMPTGGKLVIETDRVVVGDGGEVAPGDYVVLTVADTGCGMTADVQRRMFEPFFTTKERGTGLGMATSYGIVKQLGGEIVVMSELGRGTAMKVYLPRIAATAAPVLSRSTTAQLRRLRHDTRSGAWC